MPYITQEDRDRIYNSIRVTDESVLKTPGELNYMVTTATHNYLEKHGLSYTHCDEVMDVLERFKAMLILGDDLIIHGDHSLHDRQVDLIHVISGILDNYDLGVSTIGTFSCIISEFYRRVVVPYEDIKIKENGDVFPNNGVK